jgi:mRNA interferase RelE/StbE
MAYEMEIKDEAKARLKALPEDLRQEIGYRLHLLQKDFSGDVKKLKGSKNEYRLRVGDHRVLFELIARRIVFTRLAQERTSTDEHCNSQDHRHSPSQNRPGSSGRSSQGGPAPGSETRVSPATTGRR